MNKRTKKQTITEQVVEAVTPVAETPAAVEVVAETNAAPLEVEKKRRPSKRAIEARLARQMRRQTQTIGATAPEFTVADLNVMRLALIDRSIDTQKTLDLRQLNGDEFVDVRATMAANVVHLQQLTATLTMMLRDKGAK
jgi:hypothetical protein